VNDVVSKKTSSTQEAITPRSAVQKCGRERVINYPKQG
jgi:hypothetical protein